MQYATRCFMGSLFLLSSLSLWASQSQNLPAEIYQEIVANADTLADSAAVFSKLSQTSKALKQQLDAALPAIVAQLSRKHGVDKELVSFYFGPQRVKQLYPEVLKSTKKLSSIFKELLSTESSLFVMQSVGNQLLNLGALPKCADAPIEAYSVARQKYDIGFLKKNYLARKQYDPDLLDSCAFIANSFGGFTAISELSDDDGSHNALMLLELDADVLKKPIFVKLFHVNFDLEEWLTLMLIEQRNQAGYVLVLKFRSTYRIVILPEGRSEKARYFDIITRLR